MIFRHDLSQYQKPHCSTGLVARKGRSLKKQTNKQNFARTSITWKTGLVSSELVTLREAVSNRALIAP